MTNIFLNKYEEAIEYFHQVGAYNQNRTKKRAAGENVWLIYNQWLSRKLVIYVENLALYPNHLSDVLCSGIILVYEKTLK